MGATKLMFSRTERGESKYVETITLYLHRLFMTSTATRLRLESRDHADPAGNHVFVRQLCARRMHSRSNPQLVSGA
eukprot:scaffold69597_cov31-Tisochrysis_lutea.AAC.4